MQFYTLKVINLIFETSDTLTVAFKQPGLKRIKYLSGQYLTLIFRINNRRYLRPYSFSSAPGIDQTLNITVKRVPGGIVSNHIIDTLKIGDLVEVMEPLGSFILENNQINTDSNVVLWGAGSGITPLMSIAKYALQNKIGNHVTLVYGNRSHESVIFKDQLEQLKKDYSENFSLWYFFTLFNIIPNTDYFVEGRIDPQKILTIIKKEKDLNNTFHYICGPEGLKESVKFSLANFGINDNNVFSEDFSVTRDPAEFDNIITRNVLITKDGKTTQVEVVRGKSILEAGLDSLIDLSYSCQTGDCLLCKGQLKKGSIKLIGVKISPNLESNECLLCCSFPLDDFVEINIKNEN